MVAAYENQPGEVVEQPITATPPVEGEKKPEGEQKPEGEGEKKPDAEGEKKPEDGDDKKAPADLKELFAGDTFARELTADGRLSDGTIKLLEDAGIPRALVDRMVTLELANAKAESDKLEASLHTAAGSKQDFDDLIAWGKKNLDATQQTYFDEQLNGPFAAEAIALLKQRRGAVPKDPTLHVADTTNGSTVGFKSEQEMVAAMSDPRYQTDPAYRQKVASQLAVSRY